MNGRKTAILERTFVWGDYPSGTNTVSRIRAFTKPTPVPFVVTPEQITYIRVIKNGWPEVVSAEKASSLVTNTHHTFRDAGSWEEHDDRGRLKAKSK